MKRLTPLFLLFCLACNKPVTHDPGAIIDRAIEVHGGSAYASLGVAFTFRNIDYEIYRKESQFAYVRTQVKAGDTLRDELSNQGFIRKINGVQVELPDTLSAKYTASVNSVGYFLLLPMPLKDPAVKTEYLGRVVLEGKEKEKIKVTFDAAGGGEDHQDQFVYWFDVESGRMTHLAYLYYTNEGGLRFRRAINTYQVAGILIQDYENYEANPDSLSLLGLDAAFDAGKLKLLSEIKQERVRPTGPNPLK